MTPNQQKPKDLFELFCDFILGPAQLQICLQTFLAVSLFLIFQLIWHWLSPSIAKQNDYRFSSNQIEMPAHPLWISPSFRHSAIENSSKLTGREEISLLDPGLADDLANAFRADPWVREVNSVLLEYPGKVRVDLQFREPVAFVEPHSAPKEKVPSRATYQVDADGVLLPTDFIAAAVSTNPDSIHDYIWIVGLRSNPFVFGQPWGDPILEEAALFAEFLRSDFKILGITTIIAPGESENKDLPLEERSQQRVWRLKTAKGREIIWGPFPMSAVIRARSGPRADYETVKRESFQKEKTKLSRLVNLASGRTLDDLPEEEYPIDLSTSD